MGRRRLTGADEWNLPGLCCTESTPNKAFENRARFWRGFDDYIDSMKSGYVLLLWFAKTSAGTKNRAVPGRVGLYTIIARYGMKTKTLKGTNPSARGAHIYIKDRRKVGPD